MDLLRSAILVVLVGFVLCAVPPNLPIWTITLGRCKPGNGEYKIVRMNSMVGRDCMILAVGVAEEQGFEVWGFGWRDGRCSVYYQSLTTLNVPQPIGKPWDFEDFIGKTGNGPPVNTSGKPSNQSADPLKCFSGIHCMRVFAGNRYCQLPAFGAPASVPTADPATVPTGVPTAVPTSVPATVQPPGFTAKPTSTVVPTTQPTVQPPGPTPIPTPVPTAVPCATPTAEPTLSPAAVASSPTPHPASSNKTLSSIKALCSCSSLTPSSILNTGLWYCGGRGIVRGICLEAQAPGSTCPSGYVKCPTKLNIFAKHRNSGKACGCNNYQNGAVDSDAVLCWSWNFCGLPKINGRCATGFNACSGTTVIRLLISSPLRTLSSKLADACGVKEDRIHILSRCPEEACPAGVCLPTLSQRQSKGCLTSSRTSNALILDDTVQEKLYVCVYLSSLANKITNKV